MSKISYGTAEKEDAAGPLLAIIYSDFDNTIGPTIRCQTPDGFLSQEVFDSISDYVITGRQLYGKTIAVTVSDLQIVGFPLCIENEKYPRNTFLFNVSFVLDARSDPAPYEPILRKVALTLYSLEEDREFISRPETRWQLHRMLHRILEDLNARKECLLILDDANLLSLKLVHVVQEPPVVGDHQVPVFLRDAAVLKNLDWDLALRQIIPHIDGIKYAKRLAMDAEMDVDCVKAALRTLVHYDFIALVDIFKFSNVYVISGTESAAFREFVDSPAMLEECRKFVCYPPACPSSQALPPHTPTSTPATTGHCTDSPTIASQSVMKDRMGAGERMTGGARPGEEDEASPLLTSDEDLINLYRAFGPHLTLADIISARKQKVRAVDARRLVTFGVVYGFLRRVHRYPVYLPASKESNQPPGPIRNGQRAQDGTLGRGGGKKYGTKLTSQRSSISKEDAGKTVNNKSNEHKQRSTQKYPLSLVKQVQSVFDGTRTLDEACVKFMRPFEELKDIALSSEGGEVVILYK